MRKKNFIKILFIYIISFTWLLFCNISNAYDYKYRNLDISADIKIDWTIDISETFDTYFNTKRHWIIRSIPLNYSVEWKPFHIEIDNINVKQNHFKKSKEDGEILIKIGKNNKYISWRHKYPISYSAYWLIKNFSWMWYAELYWNLVGNDIDTTVDKVRAELALPKSYTWFTNDDFLISVDDKSNTIDWFDWSVDFSQWNKIIITYNKQLKAYQWITLAIKFPNNYFEFNHDRQASLIWDVNSNNEVDHDRQASLIWDVNSNNEVDIINFMSIIFNIIVCLLIPIIAIIIAVKECCKKTTRFNNLKICKKSKIWQYPIIVQYNPPKEITPSEMSFLYFKMAKPNAITCMIYKRAIEGYISISYEKWGFLKSSSITLSQNTENTNNSGEWYEGRCWSSLPRVREIVYSWHNENWTNETAKMIKHAKLPDTQFSKRIIWINESIKKSCESKWWIKKKSIKFNIIRIIIFLCILLSWLWGIYIPFILFFIVARWISVFFNKINLTEEWQKILAEIYWYKYFIDACEVNQIKAFMAQDPNFINKTLPYAAALWLETKLMDIVKPIFEETWWTLTWYNGNLDTLNSAMNSISSSSHEYHETNSYSSSSGFSSWSSFSWWWGSFHSWWWGGGWGSRSW